MSETWNNLSLREKMLALVTVLVMLVSMALSVYMFITSVPPAELPVHVSFCISVEDVQVKPIVERLYGQSHELFDMTISESTGDAELCIDGDVPLDRDLILELAEEYEVPLADVP